MPKDAKLPEIEIKRRDFNKDKQRQMAEEMIETWEKEGPTSYKNLEERYGTASASHYGNVMDRYLGPKDHDITVGDIRAEYDSVSNYLQKRKRGDIETDMNEFTDREMGLIQEFYAKGEDDGFDRGFDKGWDMALELAQRIGIETLLEKEEEFKKDVDDNSDVPVSVD